VDALDKALTMRRLIAVGKDSIEERDREQQVTSIAPALTFENAARRGREELKADWTNVKPAAQWVSTLETCVLRNSTASRLMRSRPPIVP
jgi:hypothetical protein